MIEPLIDPGIWKNRFTLGEWNTHASVRTSDHHYKLPTDIEKQLESQDWFPPALLPYLSHPEISSADPAITKRLCANHLVNFLHYTTLLEHRIVNRSVEVIIHDELEFTIPRRMKTAALQLYTDEGYHALFSNQLAEQVIDFYGMTDRPTTHRRITRLNHLIDRTPDKQRALTWFLIGFVSETIIAKDLREVCQNTLVSSVQEMLSDHLADEARHSRYFSEVFHYLWFQMSDEVRLSSARQLLEILFIFFESDKKWLERSLRSVQLSKTAVQQILITMADPQHHIFRTRSGASSTLQALKRADCFKQPEIRQMFSNRRLLDE
ncbi:aminobenzoate oxygenase [Pseudomonas sp. S35]|uniref:diiron oxygenase n=1 Tax=Pseudomonas sp. S35 TaxID=1573719 RepID=UPI00132F0B23|nr:diiron oxygenase [Pseudomonas sp. S35]QHF47508.1 aminobenzoate oxygenase [Pseudomonas sp. S35]